MWDFYLVVSATSEDFQQFSEDFRTLPKMPEDVLITIDHFQFERIVDVWKLLRLFKSYKVNIKHFKTVNGLNPGVMS